MLAGRATRNTFVFAAISVIAMLVASCASSQATTIPDTTVATTTTVEPKPVLLTLGVDDGAAGVEPGQPVVARAVDGKITEVKLTNPEGKVVSGQLSDNASEWRNTEALGYQKNYMLAVTGVGADGVSKTITSKFSTAKPRNLTYLSINPRDGTTVGVGQPLAFYFDEPIPDKAAAESMIQIKTEPEVVGAFYWFDDKTAHWRPQSFWKSGTKITINAKIYGRDLGNGLYGEEDRHITTTIGDAVVHEADGQTHQVVTKVNGEVARTMPTSMGSAVNPTPFGTYVITEKLSHMVMDSRTYGLALENGGYVTPVDWAVRMSNSGIFFHGAPWSIADQGHRNVSHGCLNLSPENAKWVFDISKPGDVVIVTNSGGPKLESWDGFGDWQIPWVEWVKGNR